jgi:carbon-monoxide dehydrogenase medium subunit
MENFNYHTPSSVADAAKLLEGAEDAKLIAGGMTLLPTLKQRLAAPSDLIDLAGVPNLKGVTREGDEIVIGAMTTHAEVHENALVREAIPGLASLAGQIGDPAVRHRGTIGGSISNADPAADYPAGLVGHGATVVTNKRKIAGMISSPACSRPRWRRARSSPRCASRSRPGRRTRSCVIRPPAMRSWACSSRRRKMACASP